jgi:hypothetical protein
VERYLGQHKDPRVTITLTALELSRLTGEPFDSFRKGQLCRCILDDTTVVQRIETIEYPAPISSPDEVVLTLASTQNDLSVTVAGLVVDTRVVNQLYHQLDRKLKIEAEEILLRATQAEVDGLSTRVGTAEVKLNDVLGELELRVSYNDFNTTMNTVSITLNAQNDAIDLKADKTYVDGLVANYVTTEYLDANEYLQARGDVDLGNVVADSVNTSWLSTDALGADTFNGGTISCSSLSINGDTLTKNSLTVVTGIDVVTSLEGRITAVQPVTTQFYYFT